MNSKKLYEKIILHAKNREDQSFKGEIHHIIPRCMDGDDSPDNLVKLTYKEHYFCHFLLTKIFDKNPYLEKAYMFMSNLEYYGKPISLKHFEELKMRNNKEMSKIRQKTKCLYYMWRHCCTHNILNPTEDEILEGWSTRRGYSDIWKKYYTEQEWLETFKRYIQYWGINPNQTFTDYKHTYDHIRKRQRGIKLSTFWYIANKGDFGKVLTRDTIISTEHWTKHCNYAPVRIKYEKWFDDEDDWVNSVVEYLNYYPIEGLTISIDNQQPNK